MADVRAQLKAKGRENKVDSFLKDLESGHIDNVTFDQPCKLTFNNIFIINLISLNIDLLK